MNWQERRARRLAELRGGALPASSENNESVKSPSRAARLPTNATAKREERAWKHKYPELPRPALPPPLADGMPRGDWFDLMSFED